MVDTPKKEETRLKLIEAAGQVFAEVGFKSATVRQITDRAGANVAAIHYYFGDKMELYRAVLHTITDRQMRDLREKCIPCTGEARLRSFVRTILAVNSRQEHPWASLLMAREITEMQEAQAESIVETVRPVHAIAEEIVKELTGGEAARIALAASFVITLCVHRIRHQPIEQRLKPEAGAAAVDLETTVEAISTFALAGIRALCGSH